MATITGTDGDDNILGTSDADTITAGGGNDTVDGGGGNDWIEGGDEAAGGDLIDGGAGDDTLLGGAGNDMISGLSGNDIVRGGAGDDELYVYAIEGSVTMHCGGGAGNDFINVYMSGRDGPQAVELDGGKGDDDILVFASLLYDPVSLLATGGEGQDTYRFWSSGVAGGLIVTDFQTGEGGDRIDVDVLLHPPARQGSTYEGGNPFGAEQGCLRLVQDGADTLLQYDPDGPDGAAYDWYTAAVLLDVDRSTLTAHNFFGIPPDGSFIAGEELVAPDFATQLEGGLGNDTLRGGSGNDGLRGAPGDDLLLGGEGDDALLGNLGDDTLYGGAGSDWLTGEAGQNKVHGGAGDDTLWCVRQGDDVLVGGAGADYFFLSLNSITQPLSVRARGGDGDDLFRVRLDSGSSVLATGGTGRDTYLIAERTLSGSPSARLTVTDFEAGTGGDCIRLSGVDAVTATAADDAFTFVGTAAFNSSNAAGQLRYEYDTSRGVGTLYGSTDADAQAEFAIELTGVSGLAAANLIL